jgi:hypothetical protein
MIAAGVKTIIVLDGCKLEMKKGIEEERMRYFIKLSLS